MADSWMASLLIHLFTHFPFARFRHCEELIKYRKITYRQTAYIAECQLRTVTDGLHCRVPAADSAIVFENVSSLARTKEREQISGN